MGTRPSESLRSTACLHAPRSSRRTAARYSVTVRHTTSAAPTSHLRPGWRRCGPRPRRESRLSLKLTTCFAVFGFQTGRLPAVSWSRDAGGGLPVAVAGCTWRHAAKLALRVIARPRWRSAALRRRRRAIRCALVVAAVSCSAPRSATAAAAPVSALCNAAAECHSALGWRAGLYCTADTVADSCLFRGDAAAAGLVDVCRNPAACVGTCRESTRIHRFEFA